MARLALLVKAGERHRTAFLAERLSAQLLAPGEPPILLTTFTKSLAEALESQLAILIEDEDVRSQVEILNVDRLAHRIVREARGAESCAESAVTGLAQSSDLVPARAASSPAASLGAVACPAGGRAPLSGLTQAPAARTGGWSRPSSNCTAGQVAAIGPGIGLPADWALRPAAEAAGRRAAPLASPRFRKVSGECRSKFAHAPGLSTSE